MKKFKIIDDSCGAEIGEVTADSLEDAQYKVLEQNNIRVVEDCDNNSEEDDSEDDDCNTYTGEDEEYIEDFNTDTDIAIYISGGCVGKVCVPKGFNGQIRIKDFDDEDCSM